MSDTDPRPPVWVGHIRMHTERIDASFDFMVKVGMRPLVKRDDFAVLELRGGTHLVLSQEDSLEPGDASFDLMVEDLDATHEYLAGLGHEPSEISDGGIHRSFTVRDPGGLTVKFNSSHVSDQPV